MRKLLTTISALALSGALLTGCSSGQTAESEPAACEQLRNEETCVPTTDQDVIDLVKGRYADCLSSLVETKEPIYARDDEGQLLPGGLLFAGADWAVMIRVGELTATNVILTVPDSGRSTEILESVGC
jgi:hypothetical protein